MVLILVCCAASTLTVTNNIVDSSEIGALSAIDHFTSAEFVLNCKKDVAYVIMLIGINSTNNISFSVKPKTYNITFNPMSGKVSQKTKTLISGFAYGSLPTPTRTGYTFSGWYTSKTGGSKVYSSTIFSGSSNITLYARWTKVTVSKPSITSCTSKNRSKAISLYYKGVSSAKGYVIQYSTNNRFTSSNKYVTTTKTSTVINKLVKGKTYYVRVRAYKYDSNNKRVYSSYSSYKKIVVR